jgi:hypothetical protein
LKIRVLGRHFVVMSLGDLLDSLRMEVELVARGNNHLIRGLELLALSPKWSKKIKHSVDNQ